MHPTALNIGAYLKVANGLSPQSSVAATVNGAAIDRSGYSSCIVAAQVGAVTGAPTTLSAAFKLQDSADGSTGWADYGTAPAAVTAIDTVVEAPYNLQGAKKFIRVVNVASFTGGTSPAQLFSATVVLGGADRNPAA